MLMAFKYSIGFIVLTALLVPFLSSKYIKDNINNSQYFLFAKTYLQGVLGLGPVVHLDYGSFQGGSYGSLEFFLGMPFAAPPVGQLRFARPQPPVNFTGIHQARDYGPACPAHNLTLNPNITLPLPDLHGKSVSEDCLSINVFRPANTSADAKLPVLFFVYGGAFALGTTSRSDLGVLLVNRSASVDHPIIYVSANYRTNAFGFMSSKELREEGSLNVGLHDQRLALQWVQNHISKFGGDPNRVIVWGQSAGAMSIAFHMLAYGGNIQGLFHGALLQSGTPFLLHPAESGQKNYDDLILLTNCTSAADVSTQSGLQCLRSVPTADLVYAINKLPNTFMYQSFSVGWSPSLDDDMFTENPLISIKNRHIAQIPVIVGTDDDEGTLFALSSLNVTNDSQFREYISLVAGTTEEQTAQIAEAYPEDPSLGSPHDTGEEWALTPQYKRISSFKGDLVWQAPRRNFLNFLNESSTTWAYLFKRNKMAGFLGSGHCSNCGRLLKEYKALDFLINFVYNLDPNEAVDKEMTLPIFWPEWGSSSEGELLTYSDPDQVHITKDDFREGPIDLLNNLALEVAYRYKEADKGKTYRNT